MTQDFRKTKIRILSEEHSKAFQEAVFAAGGKWWDSGKFHQEGVNYIFVNKYSIMSLSDNAVFFEDHDYKEIQFPLIIESLPGDTNNMTTFETAKIGDRVWSVLKGWATVNNIRYHSTYQLEVEYDRGGVDTFTFDGHLDSVYKTQILFWDEVKIEAPTKPLPNLAVDTKVLVWDNGYKFRVKGYFSHFKNGDCHIFDLGQTSWTGGSTTAWDNWELAE